MQQLAFARTESDILVQKRKPDAMDEHKKERLERKSASPPPLVSLALSRAGD